jgi:hypothetical protein
MLVCEAGIVRAGRESVKCNLKIGYQFTICSKVDKIYGKLLSVCVVAGVHGWVQFSIKYRHPKSKLYMEESARVRVCMCVCVCVCVVGLFLQHKDCCHTVYYL